MKLSIKVGILAIASVLFGCGGGGGGGDIAIQSNSPTINLNAYNDAWDKARVYLPYTSKPILYSELKDHPPSPIAISLHGCDGVQEANLGLGDKYYPIFLAMQGYLVIEPDSFYSNFKALCYRDSIGMLVLPNIDIDARVRDAEFAINKVKESKFWDQKTLLVQGQSQGYLIAMKFNMLNTVGVTKWLFSGTTPCAVPNLGFTHNQPTLIVNSDADYTAQICIDPILKSYPNVKISLIKGDFHSPITSPEGYNLIKEWVKLNK